MEHTYQLVQSPYGDELKLLAAWDDSILAVIRPETIKSVNLNYAYGWRGTDLQFLDAFENLCALNIISYGKVDLSSIQNRYTLRSLELNLFNEELLDLSAFQGLENCLLLWQKTYSGLEQCHNLRGTFLSGHPMRDASICSNWPFLIEARFASCGLETMKGIESSEDLRFVGLYHTKSLRSLAGIERLTKLRRFECAECKKVDTITALEQCKLLTYVKLSDLGEIDSLSPLFDKKCLEVLLFYGKTNILDGKLRQFLEFPNLRTVAFMDRKHYDCKASEFSQDRPTQPIFDWRSEVV